MTWSAGLKTEIRCKPSAYRFKVSLLSSLGNAYVGVIILILLGLLATLFASIVKYFGGGWPAWEAIGLSGCSFVWF